MRARLGAASYGRGGEHRRNARPSPGETTGMQPMRSRLLLLVALLALQAGAAARALEPLYPEVRADDPADLATAPVRHPVQDEVLYFLLPDRFENGDRRNDCGDYDGPCPSRDDTAGVLRHGFLPADRGYYHGGDLAGLTSRLDYLAGLGVTALWVGPIFRNKPVQGDSTSIHGHSAGYHGYWITDFLAVDPHFGTNGEFAALVDAAHRRGIKVFMDVITNHTADVIHYEEGRYTYVARGEHPYVDTDGNEFDDAGHQYRGGTRTFPTLDLSAFPYTPVVDAAERGIKNPPWLNDATMYHNRGNTSFSGENSLYGDFFGLDDLFTERPEVVEGMIDIYRGWVEDYGVDGFRIDTTKHVRIPFWQVFGPSIVDAARAAGTGHFFAFGEVASGDPALLSMFSVEGRLQSTLDFPFQQAVRAFASRGAAADTLRSFFEQDDYYTDADSNAYAMPTFVGNHDMGRIGYFLQRVDQPRATDGELLQRALLAHALMFFARGQPVIYYGDEQGYTGDGGDKLARQDMFASDVAEYNDDDLMGTDATTATANFDRGHVLYRALAGFSALYREHAALRGGAQIHRYAADTAGVYAFSRMDRDERIEYVVALNNAREPQTVSLPTFHGEMVRFEQLLPESDGETASPATGPDGRLALTVAPLGVAVLRATRAVPVPDRPPSLALLSPATGASVRLTASSRDGHPYVEPIEIRAEVDGDAYTEVTFAARSGAGAYRIIGTDDNPPYRVFYRVAGTPPEAELSFVAVADNHSGERSWSGVSGVRFAVAEAAAPERVMTEATFRYVPPPGAGVKSVSLRGTMNDWSETPMSRGADGHWSVTVTLPAGEHRYKFFIDGQWPRDMAAGTDGQPIDAQAERYADDGFGGRNAVRVVRRPETGEP